MKEPPSQHIAIAGMTPPEDDSPVMIKFCNRRNIFLDTQPIGLNKLLKYCILRIISSNFAQNY